MTLGIAYQEIGTAGVGYVWGEWDYRGQRGGERREAQWRALGTERNREIKIRRVQRLVFGNVSSGRGRTSQ